jgi:hypothetical protein
VRIGTATATSKSHKWIGKGAVSRAQGEPPFLEISFMAFCPSYGRLKFDVLDSIDSTVRLEWIRLTAAISWHASTSSFRNKGPGARRDSLHYYLAIRSNSLGDV